MPPWAADLPELGAVDNSSADSPTASTDTGARPPASDASPGDNTPTALSGTRSGLDRRRHHRRPPRAPDVPVHHCRLMHAVVLVGGFGTRLRPLTNTMPKPMLPIGNVPIIARLVEQPRPRRRHRVTLALGFLPEPFLEAFPDGRCGGVALRYAVEPEPLDTAGAIRFAADEAGIDDTFVVANGDVLTDLDVAALVRRHREVGAKATIHLTPVDDPSAFGVVELDGDGRVGRFVEKPAPGTTEAT